MSDFLDLAKNTPADADPVVLPYYNAANPAQVEKAKANDSLT